MNLFPIPKLEIPVSELSIPYSTEYKAKSRIKIYADYLTSRNQKHVTKESIRAFIDFKKSTGSSNKYVTDLKRVLKKAIELWLEKNDLIPYYYQEWEYFFRKIRLKKDKQKKHYAHNTPTKEKIFELIEKIPNPRYQLIFVSLFYLGCRPKELRELKWSDVFPHKLIHDGVEYSILRIDSYKTEERINKIPTIVLEDIKKVFQSREYIFENINHKPYSGDRLSQLVREQTRKYSDIKLTPYLFRHASASEYYNITKDDDSGAKRLGHSVLVHRSIYVHDDSVDKSEVLSFDYSKVRNRINRIYSKRVG